MLFLRILFSLIIKQSSIFTNTNENSLYTEYLSKIMHFLMYYNNYAMYEREKEVIILCLFIRLPRCFFQALKTIGRQAVTIL